MSTTKINLRNQADNEVEYDGISLKTAAAVEEATDGNTLGDVAEFSITGHLQQSDGYISFRPQSDTEVSSLAISQNATITNAEAPDSYDIDIVDLGDFAHAYANERNSAINSQLLYNWDKEVVAACAAKHQASVRDRQEFSAWALADKISKIDDMVAMEQAAQLGLYWLPPVANAAELIALVGGTLPQDGLGGTGDMRAAMTGGDAVVVSSVDALFVLADSPATATSFDDEELVARLETSRDDSGVFDALAAALVAAGLESAFSMLAEKPGMAKIRQDYEDEFKTPAASQAAVWAVHGTLAAPTSTFAQILAADAGLDEDSDPRDLGLQTKEALVHAVIKRDADAFSSEFDSVLTELAADATDFLEKASEFRGKLSIADMMVLEDGVTNAADADFHMLPILDRDDAAISSSRFADVELQVFRNGILLDCVRQSDLEGSLPIGDGFEIIDDGGNAVLVVDASAGDEGDEIQIHGEAKIKPADIVALEAARDKMDISLHFETGGMIKVI